MGDGELDGFDPLKVVLAHLAVQPRLAERLLAQHVRQVGEQPAHQIEGGHVLLPGALDQRLAEIGVHQRMDDRAARVGCLLYRRFNLGQFTHVRDDDHRHVARLKLGQRRAHDLLPADALPAGHDIDRWRAHRGSPFLQGAAPACAAGSTLSVRAFARCGEAPQETRGIAPDGP